MCWRSGLWRPDQPAGAIAGPIARRSHSPRPAAETPGDQAETPGDQKVPALRNGLDQYESMIRLAVAILALVSAVATYLGIRGLFGTSTVAVLAAIAYAGGVSAGIFVFWSILIRFLPTTHSRRPRRALLAIMVVGSVFIIGLSSWFNAAAIAGPSALQRHLAGLIAAYTDSLQTAYVTALAAQSGVARPRQPAPQSDRQPAMERLIRLPETAAGVATRATMPATIPDAADRLSALFGKGEDHLAAMRRLLHPAHPDPARAEDFARATVRLSEVIAALQRQGTPSSITAARPGDLRLTAADRLNNAALDLVIPTQPEAVLRHAAAYLPAWTAGVAIDLLPALFILMLLVARDAIRQNEAAAKTKAVRSERQTAAIHGVAPDRPVAQTAGKPNGRARAIRPDPSRIRVMALRSPLRIPGGRNPRLPGHPRVPPPASGRTGALPDKCRRQQHHWPADTQRRRPGPQEPGPANECRRVPDTEENAPSGGCRAARGHSGSFLPCCHHGRA